VALVNPTATVFWIDAGSCRESKYRTIPFPNATRLSAVISPERNGAMIFAMYRHWIFHRPPFLRCVRSDYVIGGIFGGNFIALREYSESFWALHDYFLQRGEFVGKEQQLMSTYVLYADKAWIQPNYHGHCYPWFATFSFYGNTKMCFKSPPRLLPHTSYFGLSSVWNFSISVWRKSAKVGIHASGRSNTSQAG
jgi:hypothetical protein